MTREESIKWENVAEITAGLEQATPPPEAMEPQSEKRSDIAWMAPYIRALAARITGEDAEKIHAAGLLSWREAEAAGMDNARGSLSRRRRRSVLRRFDMLETKQMKPILFNTEMVRALLVGRKSVTRRVVKLKYSNTHLKLQTDKYGTRLIEIQNEEPGVTAVRKPNGITTHKLLAAVSASDKM